MDKKEKAQYIIALVLKGFIGALVVVGVIDGNYFLAIMSAIVFFLTFLPAIISHSLRIRLPIEFDFILTLVLCLHYALGEYNGFYVKFSWWDILLHGGNSVILGLIGLVFAYSLLMTSKVAAKPIFISSFAVFFAVFVGVLWEIFEFGMDQIFGFTMQKSGLVDTMTDLMVDIGGAFFVSVFGFFYIKKPRAGIFHRFFKRWINVLNRIREGRA